MGVVVVFMGVWLATFFGAFVVLRDERPRREGASDLQRARRWLYERLLLAVLLATAAGALVVLAPYLIVKQLLG